MLSSLRAPLKNWFLQSRRQLHSGFTLLELLVAILIGGILTSGLLFLVIELMAVNNREESLTQTQQNMRRAMAYMTSDLGEAIFVYSDLTDLLDELDDTPDGTPVVAFWRLDPLSPDQVDDLNDYCDAGSLTEEEFNECGALLVRQNTYTLVVYFHQENEDDGLWEGPTRIIRYELPAYQTISASELERSPGYADPTLLVPGLTPAAFNSFASWQKATGETTDGNSAVLTDYVNVIDDTDVTAAPCRTDATYARSPADSDSFYVCVAQPSTANNQTDNKSVLVYLQGNASKRDPNQIVGLTAASSLPRLESEVLIRGVIQEDPSQP